MLTWRRHPAAPAVAIAPGAYVVYTYLQVVVGQEYLRLPGNVERFFPLLLAVFVLGEVVTLHSWTAMTPATLPVPSRRLRRTAGWALLAVAAFVLVGLHLPTLPDAWSATPARVEYVSSPTPFWLVKLMDLGMVVPAAVVTGVGLLRGAVWARRPMYAILGGYTLIGTSVAAMAITMLVNADPDASAGMTTAFVLFAGVFWALTLALYRPLLRTGRADVTPEAVPADHAPLLRHL